MCRILLLSMLDQVSALRCELDICSKVPCSIGTAYVLNTVSWAADILIVLGVVVTGLAADAGHKWAAGNRAYRPIPDHHSPS